MVLPVYKEIMTRKIQNIQRSIMEDLVVKALERRLLDPQNRQKDRPGQLIQSLGPVKRSLLKDLNSGDINDIRPDSIDTAFL